MAKADSSTEARFERLPRPIVAKLTALIRRVRRVRLIKGVLVTLAVMAAAALAIMLVDVSLTIVSDGFRRLLSLSALVIVLATGYFQIWKPLRQKIGLAEIARAVETRHPELEERLSTAVQLLDSEDEERSLASEELLTEVVKAASLDAKDVRPSREFSNKRARKPLLAVGGAAAIIAAAFVLWPGGTGKLLARVFAPFAQTGNAFSDRLSITPGDITVAEGASLTIEVAMETAQADLAELRRRIPGSAEAIERMTFIEPLTEEEQPRFSLTFPAVAEPFEYRIRSGRAVSKFYKVGVTPRPRVEEYRISYDFPSYTGLKDQKSNGEGATIEALAGTKVTVATVLDRPVKNASLYIDGVPIWSQHQILEDGKPLVSWEFALEDGTLGEWSVQLEDNEGIRNEPKPFPIRAIADASPTVRISSPASAEIQVKPTEVLPISFIATEDFGFTSTEIIVALNDEQTARIGADTPQRFEGEDNTWTGSAALDLRNLDLAGKSSVQVRIRVTDNRPAGNAEAAIATSEPITISLDRAAKSLLEQTLTRQQDQLQQSLWTAMEKLLAAKELAADKPGALVGEENPPAEVMLEIQEVGILAGEAEALVLETTDAMSATLFAELAQPLAAIANDHIEPARAAAEAIPLTDRNIGRVHQARTSVRQLEESIADLQLILRDLRAKADRDGMTAELGNLEERKRQMEAMRDKQTDSDLRNNLQEQIDELQQMADALIERSSRSLAEQFDAAGDLADDLAKRAAELAEDQNQLAEMLDQVDDLSKRQDLIVDIIRWLEAEQRDIARDCGSLREIVGAEPDLAVKLDGAVSVATIAADSLTQNLIQEAAMQASANANALLAMRSQTPKVPQELQNLASWQRSIAAQIAALGGGDIDSALSELQQELAEQAQDLAEQAGDFQDQAQDLADAGAAQQAMQAAEQISQAAEDAASASSQLGGQTSGSFQFADNPSQFATNENQMPGPPPPTRAAQDGGRSSTAFGSNTNFERHEPPPNLDQLDGSARNPFQIGEVAMDHVPPALIEDGLPQGGDLPPGYLPPLAAQNGGGQTSGRSSGADGAAGSGGSAGSGLGGAAGALASASTSLSAQANTPMAQQQPEPITPETAQERMEELAQLVARQQAPASEDSSQEWARVGGEVKSGVATGSRSQPPAEYRDMVKRYFEEIARKSSTQDQP